MIGFLKFAVLSKLPTAFLRLLSSPFFLSWSYLQCCLGLFQAKDDRDEHMGGYRNDEVPEGSPVLDHCGFPMKVGENYISYLAQSLSRNFHGFVVAQKTFWLPLSISSMSQFYLLLTKIVQLIKMVSLSLALYVDNMEFKLIDQGEF